MATVMVLDDRAENRRLLASILRHMGHRVVEASGATEAIGMAQAEIPDLIIADVVMPEMDGYAFAARLRGLMAQPIPVIFCTAAPREEVESLARRVGVQRIVTKPIEVEEIMAAVDAVVGSTRPDANHPPHLSVVPAVPTARGPKEVIHALNNMVSVIFNYADLAADRFGADPEAGEEAREMRQAARRAKALLQELQSMLVTPGSS